MPGTHHDNFSRSLQRRQLLALMGGAAVALGSPRTSFAQSATPKRGGKIRVGIVDGQTTESLDPATVSSTHMILLMFGAMYNNLAEISPSGELVPELAESWEASSDAATWRFKIRKGVEFHNGKTLTPEDVVASINHHRGPDSKSAAKVIGKLISDVAVDGKDGVVIRLKGGNSDFPYMMTDYHLVIMPSRDGTADWRAGVGTGGYRLDSLNPGIGSTARRFENYWKPDRAHFDEIELVAVNDSSARIAAILSGSLDVINRVDLSSVSRLSERNDIVIEEATGRRHISIAMRCDTAPFTDVNVRLALKLAIDRDLIVKNILRGHGKVGNDQPISSIDPFFAADIPQRTYDPEMARFYLKKAGMSDLSVDLSTSEAPYAGAVDTAVVFAAAAKKAGININVVREPNDGYYSNIWLKKAFVVSVWAGRPTADNMFSVVYARDAAWNETHWNNPRFDALLVQARAELDFVKRKAMYAEAQSLVRDDGGAIIPAFMNFVDARSAKLAHAGKVGSNAELDGWKLLERWWFA